MNQRNRINSSLPTFNEIHERGANKFGFVWLKVNQVVSKVGAEYGLNITDKKIKRALSAICYSVIVNFLKDYVSTQEGELSEGQKDKGV